MWFQPSDFDFSYLGLQNCERIKFCCSKSPSLWKFVTITMRNEHNYAVLSLGILSLWEVTDLAVGFPGELLDNPYS